MSPKIPPNTRIILRPSLVEYRLETSGGIRVVQVFFNTPIPRVSFFAEDREGRIPIVLDEEEIKAYISDAREQIQL
jgi:hypothetical protein